MKKDLTELVFIIDESGSMSGLEADTIGGINSILKAQKKEKGECLVSIVTFSNNQRVIKDRVNIKDIKLMTQKDYQPSGTTALIDTIASSVKHIKRVHKYIREEDRPNKTLFMITTDGMENASHRYSLIETKQMIEKQKEKGWEFIFLAANIDAVETGKDFGFDRRNTVNYMSDKHGEQIKYNSLSKAVSSFRKDKLDENWANEIHKDYDSRCH